MTVIGKALAIDEAEAKALGEGGQDQEEEEATDTEVPRASKIQTQKTNISIRIKKKEIIFIGGKTWQEDMIDTIKKRLQKNKLK